MALFRKVTFSALLETIMLTMTFGVIGHGMLMTFID
jgi:hypothetical protein